MARKPVRGVTIGGVELQERGNGVCRTSEVFDVSLFRINRPSSVLRAERDWKETGGDWERDRERDRERKAAEKE